MFKRFMQMIHTHTRTFFRILQMSRSRPLRELVEVEFGIHIPPKPLSRVQKLESTDSDHGNATDSDVPYAVSELDDDILPDVGNELWDLICDIIEAMYATRRFGHSF